jgi:hypothetical protein
MSPALVAQAITAGVSGRPSRGYDPGTGFGVVNATLALRQAAVLVRHRHTATGPGVQDPRKPVKPGAGVPLLDAGPIQVVRRDQRTITFYTGVAAAAGVGTIACVGVMLVLIRRVKRKEEQRPQEVPEPHRAALST